MKKYIYYITFISLSFIYASCGDTFLDVENLYEKTESNYYSTPQDIDEALTAAYASLATDVGYQNATLVAELLSDDRLAGGGPDDALAKGIDNFSLPKEDMYDNLWALNYQGVFRTNMIINYFDQAKYTDENAKNQALGEAHFLRAFFYFRLAKFFGTVPLITDPGDGANQPKASADEIFAQIGLDLKKAIEIMPSTAHQNITLGHASKWAAEALLSRVFLFYTGYYNKSDLPLVDGGSIGKAQVITWIDDCIANSGHALTPDYRNIWPYAYATADYEYASNNNLSWVGESGANIETVFAVKYSPYGNWGGENSRISYTNHLTLFMGPRQSGGVHIFQQGWGYGPVNPQLWESFEDGDIRKEGSILDVTNSNEGNDVVSAYEWGANNQEHETGYWQKKYAPIQVLNNNGDMKGMYFLMYGGQESFMLWNMQDEILIRFADVLLMAAELESPNARAYFEDIRTRAGLASKPVTLENIKTERRHEFAFEGLRYHDLLRWHDAASAFATATNIPVKNSNVDVTYTMSFRPETGGFLPIPPSQVRISGGILEQNPGW